MWTQQRGGTYGCLSVLDRQLHCDPQALPVTCCLGDVITNFLGRLERKGGDELKLPRVHVNTS